MFYGTETRSAIATIRCISRQCGLANQIGIDPEALTASAKRLSEFARTGADADFARGSSVCDRERGADHRVSPNPALGTTLGPVLTWGYICGTYANQEIDG